MFSQHLILQETDQENKSVDVLSPVKGFDDIKPIYKKILSSSDEKIPKNLQKYIIEDKSLSTERSLIGCGSAAGIVSTSLITMDGSKPIAIKTNFSDRSEKRNRANQTLWTEADLTQLLESPYTIKFLGIIESEPLVYSLAMPLYSSNLGEYLQKTHCMSFKLKVTLASQISLGVEGIHKKNYIHRDLKSFNILLDGMTAKIADFGTAAPAEKKEILSTSLQWEAPEITSEKSFHTKASDVYSLGVILWELATQRLPYEGLNPVHIMLRKLRNEHPPLPKEEACPPLFAELISSCWENDPEKRPTAKLIADTLDAALKNPTELEKVSIFSLGFFKRKESALVMPETSEPKLKSNSLT